MVHYDGSHKNNTLDIQSSGNNIIMDVLGGCSRTIKEGLRKKDKRCATKYASLVCQVRNIARIIT